MIAYVATYDRPKAARDDVDYVLRLAVCADAACSTWDDRIVDDPDPLVDISVVSVAMTVDAAGRPSDRLRGRQLRSPVPRLRRLDVRDRHDAGHRVRLPEATTG